MTAAEIEIDTDIPRGRAKRTGRFRLVPIRIRRHDENTRLARCADVERTGREYPPRLRASYAALQAGLGYQADPPEHCWALRRTRKHEDR